MIGRLAGRVIGPVATLALLAFLAGFPPAYTAQYAVLAAYMQLATAPLNPYAEHFQLRELLNGRKSNLVAGLTGLGVILLVTVGLVVVLGQDTAILAAIPFLGLGHLLLKVQAARLRADRRNGVAIALEFTLRPLTLLVLIALFFHAIGPSETALTWAFGLTGFSTILMALTMAANASGAPVSSPSQTDNSSLTVSASPWSFVLLGMMMVIATQFEVFALSRLADDEALATYKVAFQLASICGIATNFILVNNLRDLYLYPPNSQEYQVIYRRVQLQALAVSVVFVIFFGTAGFLWPMLWSKFTWLLAAAAAIIFAASAAFGPISNWFYSEGRIRPIVLSLILLLVVKLVAVSYLKFVGAITPENLLIVYGIGVLVQNLFLVISKSKMSNRLLK